LRWLIQQRGVLAIPKSGQHPRIKANFEIFDFALEAAEMARIGSLRGGKRLVSPDWAPVVWDPPWAEPAAIV
jgi:diketogulonate reductase-like aldo/keto reductase